ncbi:hypothetical protein NQ314_017413 [Rhamnusium bicolor]|uniref:Neurotransmitter-gated ion-channel ligand-binding domain-containing protein n=1 Tax=Rhamnusium bicolor TaxID=1586634 RepID=A0AAV8WVS0_9CUCU|nr:hypothetical protein NQ314_017413 [Rhamnusium bicolor]
MVVFDYCQIAVCLRRCRYLRRTTIANETYIPTLNVNDTSEVPTNQPSPSVIQHIPLNPSVPETHLVSQSPVEPSQAPVAVTTEKPVSTKEGRPIILDEITTVKPTTEGKITEPIDNCPKLSTLPTVDNLTQDEFITKLTDSCRYDRLIKPPTEGPLLVEIQIDMKHIEASDHLQFKSHILVQLHYRDQRLNYSKISPGRGNILGELPLRNKIWVPHIVIYNEKDSSLMGLDGKDVFVQISPRAYNTSSLHLNWKQPQPFQVASNLHLTEFVLEDRWSEETLVPASFNTGGLCTATMLSFITLNGGLSKNLPKVSYIKASEIWFLGCSTFIFCSMAEFAFVNVIWRRR